MYPSRYIYEREEEASQIFLWDFTKWQVGPLVTSGILHTWQVVKPSPSFSRLEETEIHEYETMLYGLYLQNKNIYLYI
jgi:hypothetical protein